MTDKQETRQQKMLGELSRRKFLSYSGVALGGMALAACGSDGGTTTTAGASPTTAAPTPTTAAGATPTTAAGATPTTMAPMAIPTTTINQVTVGYNNPNRVLRAPLYIGQTMGYFEEVGITNPLDINDADDPIAPTIGGSYHLSLFDSDVLYDFEDKATQSGDPQGLKMININLGAQPLVLIANEGITADNLAGKKVGGGREGQVNEALCKFMLQELGLDWQTDVEFINTTGGSNDWVTLMLAGTIDATVAFPRHIPLAEEVGGSALYQDFLNSPQGGFGMLQSKIDEDPNFPAAWAYAWIQAQQFCKTRDNFEEVRRILNDEWQIDFPDTAFSVFDLDATIMTRDLGFDPAEMDSWMDFVAPFGNVREGIPWRDYTDVSGLHVAQEALGLPLNPAADFSSGSENVDNY
ncbi:MAG: ABC transporter substrate-binding protein [Acidimicrobiia bacterium]|nr:ABC transporter substrate-binding protein [Acidimicrobiia bacterium]MDH5504271.1 ABC transporter substrate-binding protein [Acidimicrobiia bacterium]